MYAIRSYYARPVWASISSDKIIGTVLIGRWLTSNRIDSLSSGSHGKVEVIGCRTSGLPQDFQDAQTAITPAHPVVVKLLNPQEIASYISISDVYGEAA